MNKPEKIEGKSLYEKLASINVNDHVEKREDLSYLSWSWAWDTFKRLCPEASYVIVKADNGLPYFESESGAMVMTRVTAGGETHEMWLPVMDGANRAMKREAYQYTTKRGTNTVQAYTMFDINKTIMRCLVKNIAMFGLGLYIYAGEDLPEPVIEYITDAQVQELDALLKETNSKVPAFLDWMKVPSLSAIESKHFAMAKARIESKKAKQQPVTLAEVA